MAFVELGEITPPTPDGVRPLFPCVDCLNGPKEEWMAIVYLMWRIVYGPSATFNVDTLNASAACWNCVPEGELMQYLISLLAQYAVELDAVPTDVSITVDAACLQCEDVLPLKRKALYLLILFINSRIVQ